MRRGQSRRTSGQAGREGSWAPYGDLETPGLKEAGASEGPLENTAFSTRHDHWRHLVHFLFKRKTKKDTKRGSGRTRFSCQPHDHALGVSFGFPSHHLGLLGRLCETAGKESGRLGPVTPSPEPLKWVKGAYLWLAVVRMSDALPWQTWPTAQCVCSKSCLTRCNPADCSPPGSSVHGILQARILEWVAMLSSVKSCVAAKL